jgi:hypothetical protein
VVKLAKREMRITIIPFNPRLSFGRVPGLSLDSDKADIALETIDSMTVSV